MTLANLKNLIQELCAALDTGKYDGISVAEVRGHMERRDLIPWLRETVKDMDLSLWTADRVEEAHAWFESFSNAYAGNERRKWGIESRGLLLLVTWAVEYTNSKEVRDAGRR